MKKTILLIGFVLLLAAATFSQPGTPAAPKYLGRRALAIPEVTGISCGQKGNFYYNTTSDKYRVCTVTGTPGTWSSWSLPAGVGDVSGPGSATDNAIALFSGTGGKTLKNSLVTIDVNGSPNIPDTQYYKAATKNLAGYNSAGPSIYIGDSSIATLQLYAGTDIYISSAGGSWGLLNINNGLSLSSSLDAGIKRSAASEVQATDGSSGLGNLKAGNVLLQDDTNPSHYLTITDAEDLTGNHTLSLNANNADRTMSLSGNLTVPSAATVSGTNTGDVTADSTTDQLTGTDAVKTSNAASVAALWKQGSDVASATTTVLGDGGYFFITGTTTITDIDFTTDLAGRTADIKFGGILTLTHNASTLILPGGTNITTAAGDTMTIRSEGSDIIRVINYTRAAAPPISGTNTGDQTITLTGNVTGSGTGSFAATIANSAVTYAKIQNISATQNVLGRNTAGAGVTEEVTASQVLDWRSSTQGQILYRGASTWDGLAVGTAGQVLSTGGASANPSWVNPPGGLCTTFNVSGSDATTTGQTLVDITGLVTGTLALNSNYTFHSVLYVTTTAVTTGIDFGVHVSVAPTRIAANFTGATTAASNLQTMQVSGTNADNISSAPFLTTASEEGAIQIAGFFTTAGSGTPVFSLRHLKVTSGTSTVKIGSWMTVCKQ